MAALHISMLGRFQVLRNGTVAPGFGAQKEQELFGYLLTHRATPHHREKLATLLWQDASSAQSRQYFRKALWQLQTDLDNVAGRLPVLIVEPEWIQVNARADLKLDLLDFEETFATVKHCAPAQLTVDHVAQMARAVQLYHGELLQGWYQEWCVYERERIQHMYLFMLDSLVQSCMRDGQYQRGIEYATLVLRCDPAREYTHRQLMYLYALSGDRTSAIRQYARCADILRKELGVEPAATTQELHRAICSDTVHVENALYRRPTAHTDDTDDTATLADIADQIGQLQQQLQRIGAALEQHLGTQPDAH